MLLGTTLDLNLYHCHEHGLNIRHTNTNHGCCSSSSRCRRFYKQRIRLDKHHRRAWTRLQDANRRRHPRGADSAAAPAEHGPPRGARETGQAEPATDYAGMAHTLHMLKAAASFKGLCHSRSGDCNSSRSTRINTTKPTRCVRLVVWCRRLNPKSYLTIVE